MSFFSILAALSLEQWQSFRWRRAVARAFYRYAGALERKLNAGERGHGVIAAVLALLPATVLAWAVYYALYRVHPVLAWLWNVLLLYVLMGFRHFSHAYGEISDALRAGDITMARRYLESWRGASSIELSENEIARLSIEQGMLDSFRNVFGILFWFVLLPGPSGAVLYCLAAWLAGRWQSAQVTPFGHSMQAFGWFAGRLRYWLDWIPARLTALSFAIVGDFEDAVHCWRTQAAMWPAENEGIILASGAGALGVRLGEPLRSINGEPLSRPELGVGEEADGEIMPSAVGMVWRALLLWVVLILLMTLAHWAA